MAGPFKMTGHSLPGPNQASTMKKKVKDKKTKLKEAKIDIVGKRKPQHFLTKPKTLPMEGYIDPINTPKGVKGPKLPRKKK